MDGRSDGEVIHIEGSRVTGQGGKHNRSKSNGSPGGAGTEYNEGSPTEITGNILGRDVRMRGKHSGQDLTGVGGNGVRTQVLTYCSYC